MTAVFVPGDVRVRADKALSEYTTPFGGVVDAAFEGALEENPISALNRIRELDDATYGAPTAPSASASSGLMPNDPAFGIESRPRPSTPILSAEEARKRVADENLKLTIPDEGIPSGALDILIRRKRDEVRRQDAIARASADIFTQSSRFGAALGASVLDPLNVGLAFIPAVGPVRYAMMLEKAGGALGRAGIRAGVGAIEGAVGAAVVEPLIYAAAQQQQADYTLTDSLLNIAFGTAFGGGLHAGGGAIGDAWRSFRPTEGLGKVLSDASPETREATLRTAVAQMAEGRAVDVEGLLALARGETTMRRSEGAAVDIAGEMERIRALELDRAPRSVTLEDLDRLDVSQNRALYSDILDAVRYLKEDTRIMEAEKRPSLSTFIQQNGGIRESADLRGEFEAMGITSRNRPGLVSKAGKHPDEMAELAWSRGYFREGANADTRPTLREFLDALREDFNGQREVLPAGSDSYLQARDRVGMLDQKLNEIGVVWRGQSEESIVSQLRELLPRDAAELPGRSLSDLDRQIADMQAAGVSPAGIKAAVARKVVEKASEPSISPLADQAASQAAVERARMAEKIDAAEAPKAELAEALDDIDRLTGQLGDEQIRASVVAELADYDTLAEQAETFSRATRAAALCSLRRGTA